MSMLALLGAFGQSGSPMTDLDPHAHKPPVKANGSTVDVRKLAKTAAPAKGGRAKRKPAAPPAAPARVAAAPVEPPPRDLTPAEALAEWWTDDAESFPEPVDGFYEWYPASGGDHPLQGLAVRRDHPIVTNTGDAAQMLLIVLTRPARAMRNGSLRTVEPGRVVALRQGPSLRLLTADAFAVPTACFEVKIRCDTGVYRVRIGTHAIDLQSAQRLYDHGLTLYRVDGGEPMPGPVEETEIDPLSDSAAPPAPPPRIEPMPIANPIAAAPITTPITTPTITGSPDLEIVGPTTAPLPGWFGTAPPAEAATPPAPVAAAPTAAPPQAPAPPPSLAFVLPKPRWR